MLLRCTRVGALLLPGLFLQRCQFLYLVGTQNGLDPRGSILSNRHRLLLFLFRTQRGVVPDGSHLLVFVVDHALNLLLLIGGELQLFINSLGGSPGLRCAAWSSRLGLRRSLG